MPPSDRFAQFLVGDASERLHIPADEAAQARLVRDGIPYSLRTPLTGALQFVKVVVYDYGSDLMGTVTLNARDIR